MQMFQHLSAFLMGRAAPREKKKRSRKKLEAPFAVKRPWTLLLLTSACSKLSSLILWQKLLSSCPRAKGCFPEWGRASLPCLDTWCKDEDGFWYFFIAVRQTEKNPEKYIQGKRSFPYKPFFLQLNKYEGLGGQDTTQSGSGCIKRMVWQQLGLRTTSITEMSGLDFWAFPAVFLQP